MYVRARQPAHGQDGVFFLFFFSPFLVLICVNVCMCVCMCVRLHVYVCMCVCILYACMIVYAHKHTHTHTHTQAWPLGLSRWGGKVILTTTARRWPCASRWAAAALAMWIRFVGWSVCASGGGGQGAGGRRGGERGGRERKEGREGRRRGSDLVQSVRL